MARGAPTASPRRPRRVLGLDPEQRQAARRRLVLDAALELFGTQGYAATTIEQLCHTAAVGTNSFYDLFATKEAVLVALYDELSDRLRGAVTDAFANHADAERDAIAVLVGAFVHAATDDPRVARVAFIEAAGVSAEVERHRRATREGFVAGLEAIGTVLRDRALGDRASGDRASGDRRVTPAGTGPSPRRNAVALVGAIIEMTVDWLADEAPDPVDALIGDITHHCARVLDAIVRERATG